MLRQARFAESAAAFVAGEKNLVLTVVLHLAVRLHSLDSSNVRILTRRVRNTHLRVDLRCRLHNKAIIKSGHFQINTSNIIN